MSFAYTDIVYEETEKKISETLFEFTVSESAEQLLERVAWHCRHSLLPQAFLTELLFHIAHVWQCATWARLIEIYCRTDGGEVMAGARAFASKWHRVEKRLVALRSKRGTCLVERYRQVDARLRRLAGDYEFAVFGYFYLLLENDERLTTKAFIDHLRFANETGGKPLKLPVLRESDAFFPWFQRHIARLATLRAEHVGDFLRETIDRGLMTHVSRTPDAYVSTMYQWMCAARNYVCGESMKSDTTIVSILWECFVLLGLNDATRRLMAQDMYPDTGDASNVMPYWLCLGGAWRPGDVAARIADLKSFTDRFETLMSTVWKENYCAECARTLMVQSFTDSLAIWKCPGPMHQDSWDETCLSTLAAAANHMKHAVANHEALFMGRAYTIECSLMCGVLSLTRKRSLASIDPLVGLLCHKMDGRSVSATMPVSWIAECVRSFLGVSDIDSVILACVARLFRWMLTASKGNDARDLMAAIAKEMPPFLRRLEQSPSGTHEATRHGATCLEFFFTTLLDVCDLEAELSHQKEDVTSLRLTNQVLKLMGAFCPHTTHVDVFLGERVLSFLLAKLRDRARPKIQANSVLALQIVLRSSGLAVRRRKEVFQKICLIDELIAEGLASHGVDGQTAAERAKIEQALQCILILLRDGEWRAMLCHASLLSALSNLIECQHIMKLNSGPDMQILGDTFKIGLWYFGNSRTLDEGPSGKFIENAMRRIVEIPEHELMEHQIIDDLVLLLGLTFQNPVLWPVFRQHLATLRFPQKLSDLSEFMRQHPASADPAVLHKVSDFASRLAGFL